MAWPQSTTSHREYEHVQAFVLTEIQNSFYTPKLQLFHNSNQDVDGKCN